MMFSSNYPAGADQDRNAPWNQVDDYDEVMFGETEVNVEGMDYHVVIDHGFGSVRLALDETDTDLRGMIPGGLYDRIVDVAKEKLSK